ncbi:MAG: class I SAM-dependent methyltransferase [Planctomycetota bacterium JB042]
MERERHVDSGRDLFDGWARSGRSDSMAEAHGPAARPAFERIPLERDSWYLDVGCGNGYSVRWAAERAPAGRATGIDVSLSMIERAKELSAEFTNVEFLRTEFPEQALPEGRFDGIFSMEAFYYLDDLEGGLARVHDLLRPGGTFVCVVDYYAENTASHTWPKEVGVRMRLHSALGWKNRFEAAGLTVVEQGRIKLPPEIASAEWKTKQGSLLTVGRRAGA